MRYISVLVTNIIHYLNQPDITFIIYFKLTSPLLGTSYHGKLSDILLISSTYCLSTAL